MTDAQGEFIKNPDGKIKKQSKNQVIVCLSTKDLQLDFNLVDISYPAK
jgi:hypothetical protein